MGADESTLQNEGVDGENRSQGKKIPEEAKQEFANSMRTLYARRYLTSSEQLFARDANNGKKIEPVRKAVLNHKGESCFETELYVAVIARNVVDNTYLMPVEKATYEISVPLTIVNAGETFRTAAERILDQTFKNYDFDLSGVFRIEITPSPATTKALCIYEAIYKGDGNEPEAEIDLSKGLYSLEWLSRKQIGRNRKRTGMLSRSSSKRGSTKRMSKGRLNGSERAGTITLNNNLSVIAKWIDSGTFAFPIEFFSENGAANEPAPLVKSSLKDLLAGNKYAYRVRLCCVLNKTGEARFLYHKKKGLPQKHMKICTSFEDVANDLLIDLCELLACEAELDAILDVHALHCSVRESNEDGHLTVTFLSVLPSTASERAEDHGFKWIGLKGAKKANIPEFELMERCATSSSLFPKEFLCNERTAYSKLTPTSLAQIIEVKLEQ